MAAGRDLGASMSQYLIDHLSALPNVEVRGRTQVAEVEADDRLRAVILRAGDAAEPVRLDGDAVPARDLLLDATASLHAPCG